MKRTITTLVLAASMMLLAIPAASATHVDETKDHGYDESQDTAGDGTEQCRPGAQDNDLVGSWTLKTKAQFIADVVNRYGIDPEVELERYQRLLNSAQATWDFCDKNRDGFLCVMTFNDVSPYGYTLLDNRPFGH